MVTLLGVWSERIVNTLGKCDELDAASYWRERAEVCLRVANGSASANALKALAALYSKTADEIGYCRGLNKRYCLGGGP